MKLIGPETLANPVPTGLSMFIPRYYRKHGGQGMYGRRVHQAVKDAGETETGITIHLVDEVYDHGKIVLHRKHIPLITRTMTVETIEEKVKAKRNRHFISRLVRKILSGDIQLD